MQALIHPCAIGDAKPLPVKSPLDAKCYTLLDTHIHKPSAGDMEGKRELNGHLFGRSGDFDILGWSWLGDLTFDLTFCQYRRVAMSRRPHRIADTDSHHRNLRRCSPSLKMPHERHHPDLSGWSTSTTMTGLEIPCVRTRT